MIPATSVATDGATPRVAGVALDRFSYDDAIVRKFLFATFVWGVVGMLAGLLIALQLASWGATTAPSACSRRACSPMR
jgi:cbb3-type cytochrome oxidase subunit 1